jgi:hypothetical protein
VAELTALQLAMKDRWERDHKLYKSMIDYAATRIGSVIAQAFGG